MNIWPVHQRLAEFYFINAKRELTDAERSELLHCLAVHAKHCWKIAELENMSLLASMTNDTEWMHQICKELEQIQRGR